MPQGVGGVTDFARDFSAGAGLVRAAWDRQERMMQLRAAEAHQAMQERQLAAQIAQWNQQAELNRQKLQMVKEQKEQDAADLLTARDYQMYQTEVLGLPKEQAAQQTLDVLSAKNPKLALQVAKAHTEQAKTQYYQSKADDSDGFQPEIMALKNPVTGEDVAVLKTSKGGATMVGAKEKSNSLGVVEKAEIGSIYSRIKVLQKAYDAIDPKAEDADMDKRNRLTIEIGNLRKKAKAIESAQGSATKPATTPAAQQPKLELKLGATYRNADGKKAIYKGGPVEDPASWEETE